jgi:hypothetical protein
MSSQYNIHKGTPHCIATLPSTLPTANPLLVAAVKHDMTRVCHFNGDAIVYTQDLNCIQEDFGP